MVIGAGVCQNLGERSNLSAGFHLRCAKYALSMGRADTTENVQPTGIPTKAGSISFRRKVFAPVITVTAPKYTQECVGLTNKRGLQAYSL